MGPEAVVPIRDDADTFLEQPGDQRRAVLDPERLLDRLPQPLEDRDAALLPHRPHTVIAADLIQSSLEGLSGELPSSGPESSSRTHRRRGDRAVKTVDLADATETLSAYARKVRREPLVVTRSGKPVLALMPLSGVDRESLKVSTSPTVIAIMERSRALQARSRHLHRGAAAPSGPPPPS
jgi:antitoxin (DNA-binding transcriptional repressor) of toxin-antitoxin stability system